jgi:hypothetical protein
MGLADELVIGLWLGLGGRVRDKGKGLVKAVRGSGLALGLGVRLGLRIRVRLG